MEAGRLFRNRSTSTTHHSLLCSPRLSPLLSSCSSSALLCSTYFGSSRICSAALLASTLHTILLCSPLLSSPLISYPRFYPIRSSPLSSSMLCSVAFSSPLASPFHYSHIFSAQRSVLLARPLLVSPLFTYPPRSSRRQSSQRFSARSYLLSSSRLGSPLHAPLLFILHAPRSSVLGLHTPLLAVLSAFHAALLELPLFESPCLHSHRPRSPLNG